MQDDQRLIELEIKLSHTERSLEDLSEVMYRQQLEINKLEKSLLLLTKRLNSGAPGELEIGPANEKPPHY